MMEKAIDLSEEALSVVCETAEQLKGSVVAAEEGLIESLRWSGALPLLLRDFEVPNVLDLDTVWQCASRAELLQLLDPIGFALAFQQQQQDQEDEERFRYQVDRLVLLVTGFLYDYEPQLRHLVALQVVRHVVVCSSISEKAHECFLSSKPVADGRAPDPIRATTPTATAAANTPRKMDFDAFAQSFGGSGSSFQLTSGAAQELKSKLVSPRQATQQDQQPKPSKEQKAQVTEAAVDAQQDEEEDDEDWEWNESEDAKEQTCKSPPQKPNEPIVSPRPKPTLMMPLPPPNQAESTRASVSNRCFNVSVVPFPLVYAPIMSTKTKRDEPSLFVLSNPICARAFPLLLSHLHDQQAYTATSSSSNSSTSTSTSTTSSSGATTTLEAKRNQQTLPIGSYSHVKEVVPEHIPPASRRAWKLVAHHLAEMLTQLHLEAKERIYAVGSTSLKIGHTLLRILQESHEELNAHVIDEFQPASVVLIDRTNDLATPCNFNDSLLDQIFSLLPQAPTSSFPTGGDNQATQTRPELHVTELFPLHSCLPSPVSLESMSTAHQSSSFLDAVNWKGGVALCHSNCARNLSEKSSEVFRALVLRPAKLALRELDRKLQELELAFVKQGQLPRTSRSKTAMKRTGSERPRGRDVVLRRLCSILDAGEPTQQEQLSLVQLAIIMLETLERMEQRQTSWDKCRELAVRQLQLSRQGGSEWILPELADTIQRQQAAAASSPSKEWDVHPVDLMALVMHAFSVSSGAPIEEYTMRMIHGVLSEMLLQNARTKPEAMRSLFPTLMEHLTPVLETEAKAPQCSQVQPVDDEEWDWNDLSPQHATTRDNHFENLHAKAICEEFSETLLKPLKECAQLFSKSDSSNLASTPKASASNDADSSTAEPGLVAQVCEALMSATSQSKSIPDFQKVVDASEQLTRAGIDLLKSGFSRFGFGAGGRSSSSLGSQHLGPSKVVVVFVVGGITIQEVQQVREALADNARYQVLLGGTTLTNSQILTRELFGKRHQSSSPLMRRA